MKRRGNCYVTCEALFHLLKRAGEWIPGHGWGQIVPHRVRHEGDVHWYLVVRIHDGYHEYFDRRGSRRYKDKFRSVYVDPTSSQFKTRPPYEEGRASGFLTKEPSKRARALMDQLVWQEPKAGPKRSARRTTRR